MQESRPVNPSDPSVTRRVDLDPADWFRATWRKLEPLARPAPPSFDLAGCVTRLLGLTTTRPGSVWNWEAAAVPLALSRQEAHFWFRAMTAGDKDARPRPLAQHLGKYTFDGSLTPQDIEGSVAECQRTVPGAVLIPLAHLLTPEQILEVLLTAIPAQRRKHNEPARTAAQADDDFSHHFARAVLPYLSSAERDRLRRRLLPEIHPSKWHNSWRSPPPLAFRLAALLGTHDELLSLVAGWNDRVADPYAVLADIVFGLGSARLVAHHLRRLPCLRWRLSAPARLRAWLAHTEVDGLAEIRDLILALKPAKVEELMEVFCLIKAPAMAPLLLELKLAGRGPQRARQWLDEQVGNAVAGLLPLAAGRGKLADAALDYLRDVRRKGLGALIEEQARQAPARIGGRVRRAVLEHTEQVYPVLADASLADPLRSALEGTERAQAPPLPSWLHLTRLPPLLIDGQRLGDGPVQAVVDSLRGSKLDRAQPLVRVIKDCVAPAVLDAFAWRLGELWVEDGAPAPDGWVMTALGLFGGDVCAMKLSALIRDWPDQGFLERALGGLVSLRTIGTDTALTHLHGIAHKHSNQKLRDRARELIRAIAGERQLSPEQLEDRTVPALGLDLSGHLFDFGPRQFRAVIGAGLKPLLYDGAGREREDLPRPCASDAAQATAAMRDWRHFKRQLRETVRVQVARLERAMLSGRRWEVRHFETLVVRHPLMTHLARLLLWAGCDARGNVLDTFRVTEDGKFADVRDEPCALDRFAQVGLVHPVTLSAEQRSAWGEVFGDYELLPPFAQLARAVHTVPAGEVNECEVKRFNGIRLSRLTLLSALAFAGWSEHWGGASGRIRHFPGADVTALIKLRGWPTRAIEGVQFLPGPLPARHTLNLKAALKLDAVNPIVFSEVMEVVTALAAKGT